eukprot:1593802-Pleurochrysis_carterae.AAC.3
MHVRQSRAVGGCAFSTTPNSDRTAQSQQFPSGATLCSISSERLRNLLRAMSAFHSRAAVRSMFGSGEPIRNCSKSSLVYKTTLSEIERMARMNQAPLVAVGTP